MEKFKIHSGQMEIAVVNLIDYRRETIVPNVYYGLGLNHECDLLCLDKLDRFTEIEIKISSSDLKADFKKSHNHESKIISRLVYAMPNWLVESHGHLIPLNCGIISVRKHFVKEGVFIANWFKTVKHSRKAPRVSRDIKDKFLSLGAMRIWSLKQHCYNLRIDYDKLRGQVKKGAS